MDISTVFFVTDFKTKETFSEEIEGFGQEPIKYLRKEYPRFSKFVLEGWKIDGDFVPLRIR